MDNTRETILRLAAAAPVTLTGLCRRTPKTSANDRKAALAALVAAGTLVRETYLTAGARRATTAYRLADGVQVPSVCQACQRPL